MTIGMKPKRNIPPRSHEEYLKDLAREAGRPITELENQTQIEGSDEDSEIEKLKEEFREEGRIVTEEESKNRFPRKKKV